MWLQVDLADIPALFCGPHRNSPKLVGDTSRRHSSIPRRNSTDKGAPLAAPESSSILAPPENTFTISENQNSTYADGSGNINEKNAADATTPIFNDTNNYNKSLISLPFGGPLRRRFRETDSFDAIPNKQIERMNSITKRSYHSLQARFLFFSNFTT